MIEFDVALADGRTLHAYDTGGSGPAVCWLHGTPNIGTPPTPLFADATRLGLRWISYDRPGYGGSTPNPGRTVASAASDVRSVADALDIDRFAVFGHSGGGPHALACGTSNRITAVVAVAGLAPYTADGLDWFDGMSEASAASLRAALAGDKAKEDFERFEAAKYDMDFTLGDLDALGGDWSWFGEVVGPAVLSGPAGLVADDLAYVRPWGFDPADVTPPVLLLHGGQDRVTPAAHSAWLADRVPSAEFRRYPEDGHISVLHAAPAALTWVRDHS